MVSMLLVIVAIVSFIGHTGAAADLTVDPRWTDETVIPSDLDYGTTAFGTITAAIDTATDGDRIVLNPGCYEAPAEQFPIVVDKSITICSAEGAAETMLSGPSTATVLEIQAEGAEIEGLSISFGRYGVIVLADKVRICSNRLLLSAREYRPMSCGLWLAGAREARIEDNEFIDCGLAIVGPPISATSDGLPVLTGLFEVGENVDFFTTHRIESNLVNGAPLYYLVGAEGGSVPADAGQVILADCHDLVVDGLNVSWSSIGVEVAYCTGIQIRNVTASNCGLFGIYLCYSDNCEITAATCAADTHGLDLRAADRNIIQDCTVTRCGQGIFLSWDSFTSLAECDVRDNGVGMLVASGMHNLITSSSVMNNEIGIHVLDERAMLLADNLISGNTTTGIRLRSVGSTLHGNCFLENWVGLIATESDEIAISDCEFRANAQCGLYMMNIDKAMLAQNRVVDNANYHIEVAGSLTETFITHNFFDGVQGLIANRMLDSIDLRLNWWGTTNPEQVAECCEGAVDYAPFLTAMP